jgi:hypothetical protein
LIQEGAMSRLRIQLSVENVGLLGMILIEGVRILLQLVLLSKTIIMLLSISKSTTSAAHSLSTLKHINAAISTLLTIPISKQVP